MDLDGDNHSTPKLRVRKSMDLEFHDHTEEDNTEHLTEDLNQSSSHLDPAADDDEESFEDSFGEASDSCQPDHEFLEQILEEYHPERLNLLDQTVPESVYNKKPRSVQPTEKPSPTEGKSAAIPGNEVEASSAEPSSSLNIDANGEANGDAEVKQEIRQGIIQSNEEEDTEEGEEDSFNASASELDRRAPKPGIDRQGMLGSMGKSTKKSLRTINGTFWSQPFKGLQTATRSAGSKSDISAET